MYTYICIHMCIYIYTNTYIHIYIRKYLYNIIPCTIHTYKYINTSKQVQTSTYVVYMIYLGGCAAKGELSRCPPECFVTYCLEKATCYTYPLKGNLSHTPCRGFRLLEQALS